MFVDQMADLIKENGQQNNIVVYEDTNIDDGKRYTVLAGERRCKAIMKLVDEGESDGMILARIVEKPENEDQEMINLIQNNAQRNKSDTVRKMEVWTLKEIWDNQKSYGDGRGSFKDWAAGLIGVSSRTIDRYLATDEPDVMDSDNENTEVAQDEVKEAKEQLKSLLKELNKELNSATYEEYKVNVSAGMVVSFSSQHDVTFAQKALGEYDPNLRDIFEPYKAEIIELTRKNQFQGE